LWRSIIKEEDARGFVCNVQWSEAGDVRMPITPNATPSLFVGKTRVSCLPLSSASSASSPYHPLIIPIIPALQWQGRGRTENDADQDACQKSEVVVKCAEEWKAQDEGLEAPMVHMPRGRVSTKGWHVRTTCVWAHLPRPLASHAHALSETAT